MMSHHQISGSSQGYDDVVKVATGQWARQALSSDTVA